MNSVKFYRSEIDGLRAFAVFSVIFFHLGFKSFSGGYLGVDIFFVISGYLITSLILIELKNKEFVLVNFYERRIRRIIPVLYFVILISILFSVALLKPIEMISFGKSLIANTFFISNILFWREGGYFDILNHHKPLFHTWSLGVEEQYYLLFPIFLLIIWKFGKRASFAFISISFLISFFLADYLVFNKSIFSFYMLPTRGWELLAGSLSAIYLQENFKKINNTHLKNILSFIGFFIISFSIFVYDEGTPTPSMYTLFPVVGSVMVIIFTDSKSLVLKFLSLKLFVRLGLISFSLYLWHQPLIVFSGILNFEKNLLFYLFYLPILLIISFLSWRFIEKPFRKKNNISFNLIFKLFLLISFFFILLGSIIILKNGNLWKFNENQMKLFNNNFHNEYVWTKFKSLESDTFQPGKDKKLLIIGDSNGADLVNIVTENNILENNNDIRTFNIPFQCLNVDVKFEEIKFLIKRSMLQKCQKINWYNNSDLQNLIKDASAVILASNWKYIHKDLIIKSYNNLNIKYGDKFIIFGQKKIEFNIEEILNLKSDNFFEFYSVPDKDSYELNSFLKTRIKKFVDPYEHICDDNKCSVFNQKKILIYDGFHFTLEGSKFFGKKMEYQLKKLINK
jgi:peptidoglycan/LPS O-acetylase OafA/YrhL